MNTDEDERVKWEHRMMKIMMGLCAGMIFLCAAVVYHIIQR